MAEYTWISVAQPLFVARTGMGRSQLGQSPRKTERAWQETLEDAESGLEDFCKPMRVYGLGFNDDGGSEANTAYLTARGVYHDGGNQDDEVLITGDDAVTTEKDARKWVTNWLEKAKKRLAEMDAD